ncbi:Mo-dependent nitrogenase C-terminal domain-containing protein [Leptolyngbya sp. FACHB-36]|uniref:Mo-dependent nitrogenase C-terminal domain-containing protein n=1 Tax=Leptolyngbya sp. FACHB-36 TaxID=2692808 RepID=UPI001680211E|nr:Mo-dependent nitrogenase C-terminal domain-containing protein [Leptolyngbya sp. FACHB-36]MBD2022561.1 Mo-dependent nitrogenase C-terminal domain-containing protein [Leptolyngbya sp. FACHB-36]
MKAHGTSATSEPTTLIWTSGEITLNAAEIQSKPATSRSAPLQPVRQWFDNLSIGNPKTARLVCQLIPAQCPFERTVTLFGRPVLHIPPLCKLNPLYEQFVGLRFRSLCYLADECGEDISRFC